MKPIPEGWSWIARRDSEGEYLIAVPADHDDRLTRFDRWTLSDLVAKAESLDALVDLIRRVAR